MRHNNNPKDRTAFIEFKRKELELSRQTSEAARQLKIEGNLDKWSVLLDDNLKKAMPSSLPKTMFPKLTGLGLKPPYNKQIVLCSKEMFAASFTAHSIIYALIKLGVVTPSEVKKTNLLEGYNNINGMFQSRKWKDDFFDDGAKVLLIEASSKSLNALAPRGEEQFWSELAEFTRNKDKLVIINYLTDDEERQKQVFVPRFTNDGEMNTSLVKKSSFVFLNDMEEKEIEKVK